MISSATQRAFGPPRSCRRKDDFLGNRLLAAVFNTPDRSATGILRLPIFAAYSCDHPVLTKLRHTLVCARDFINSSYKEMLIIIGWQILKGQTMRYA
ncbi:hypothetical protein [Burkholderia sp. WSM2230]|uniref:hypothetical protein n=1 Tax=Burkholderia sp. WSM2230 TaxID=944435 RepID=UPI0012EC3445|nr:hypothetical protein [Burkholderia sp. WSM2230]